MAKINLPQMKKIIPISSGTNLMAGLLSSGAPVASSCGGDGICGKCRIYVSDLKIPLPPPSPLELATLEKANAENQERLSCQLSVASDMTIKTTYW